MKRETRKDAGRNLVSQREGREPGTLVSENRMNIVDQPLSWPRAGGLSGMFTFRYSCTEIYSQDGNIHVRSKQTRYQDGRLTSEECEGTLDGRAYERMVSEAQGLFLNQIGSFMKLLYAPFAARSRRHDE
ncbi:hypothetical protein GCM10027343_21580 [Noviherbaspirillum agri]